MNYTPSISFSISYYITFEVQFSDDPHGVLIAILRLRLVIG